MRSKEDDLLGFRSLVANYFFVLLLLILDIGAIH
jgi:hypothetical protein